jgi:peptidoglycan DL-endopeptidase LytE
VNKFAKRVVVAVCCTLSIPSISFASTSSYTVLTGDSLWGIAQSHKTSVQNLMNLNQLHSSSLRVGQKLVISPTNSPSNTAKNLSSPQPPKPPKSTQVGVKTTTVTVHAGDTLSAIAHRYHVSLTSMEQWNGLNGHSVLHIGQHLKIESASAPTPPLTSRSEGITSLSGDVLGAKVADYAQQFLGVPYRWGGTSPSGFDCSGFVQFVYNHFGIHLPRTSYDMATIGIAVSKSDLLPGDIVLSSAYGPGSSHVGIYIGGGKFIGAQSRGVGIASLSENYWSSHYYGARRVGK